MCVFSLLFNVSRQIKSWILLLNKLTTEFTFPKNTLYEVVYTDLFALKNVSKHNLSEPITFSHYIQKIEMCNNIEIINIPNNRYLAYRIFKRCQNGVQ